MMKQSTEQTSKEYKGTEYPLIHIYNALQELAEKIGLGSREYELVSID